MKTLNSRLKTLGGEKMSNRNVAPRSILEARQHQPLKLTNNTEGRCLRILEGGGSIVSR
ncbi:uncharacterized protein METZ01_LOCUS472120, partial [marine metagenome]